jgi:hypothetical protein
VDAWTFRKRLTVGVLVIGLGLVCFDLMTGAEWFAAALQVVQGVG